MGFAVRVPRNRIGFRVLEPSARERSPEYQLARAEIHVEHAGGLRLWIVTPAEILGGMGPRRMHDLGLDLGGTGLFGK